MTRGLTTTTHVHFNEGRGPREVMKEGEASAAVVSAVPPISRPMALAIHMQDLVGRGEVPDCPEPARLAHVSRARITQIMNLLLLAPDIQEALLFVAPTDGGCGALASGG